MAVKATDAPDQRLLVELKQSERWNLPVTASGTAGAQALAKILTLVLDTASFASPLQVKVPKRHRTTCLRWRRGVFVRYVRRTFRLLTGPRLFWVSI